MASVFRQPKRHVWNAQVKIWDAAQKRLVWRKIATGCRDKDKALAFAVAYENASGEARAGGMTRSRAEALVASMLQLAGVPYSGAVPSLLEFGGEFLTARKANVTPSTARKYAAHWKALGEWAGDRMGWPLDRWTPALCASYYRHLASEFSQTTANDHLRTLAMIFLRAEAAGHVRGNPVAMVERTGNDSVEKHVITREETAKLLKAMRGNDAWRCLTLLGWHTGHRINDLLQLTGASVKHAGGLWTVTFQPEKKKAKGRTVVLPVPRYVAKMLRRVGGFKDLNGADNRNGSVSDGFVKWLRRAGVDPLPVERGKRTIHLKSFHSFRHAMASRLTAAGVSGELARLVTDHDSVKTHRIYVHAEVQALAGALKKAGRVGVQKSKPNHNTP
jgi:site-specific recombinase XerD